MCRPGRSPPSPMGNSPEDVAKPAVVMVVKVAVLAEKAAAKVNVKAIQVLRKNLNKLIIPKRTFAFSEEILF